MSPGLYDLIEDWFSDHNLEFTSIIEPDHLIKFVPLRPKDYCPSTRVILDPEGLVTIHFDTHKCNILELDPRQPEFFNKMAEFLSYSRDRK